MCSSVLVLVTAVSSSGPFLCPLTKWSLQCLSNAHSVSTLWVSFHSGQCSVQPSGQLQQYPLRCPHCWSVSVVGFSVHSAGQFQCPLQCPLGWSVSVSTAVSTGLVSFSVHSAGQFQCPLGWSVSVVSAVSTLCPLGCPDEMDVAARRARRTRGPEPRAAH